MPGFIPPFHRFPFRIVHLCGSKKMKGFDLRRMRAIVRKEFLHILRDPFSLGMAIGLPAMMLVIFGFALTQDVDRVPLIVWDQNRTPASRKLIAGFDLSRYFTVVSWADGYDGVERALDTRLALAALVIPTDFAARADTGRAAPLQLIVDGSDANTATIAVGYAESVVRAFAETISVERQEHIGLPVARSVIDLRPRVWFNEDLLSRNFIIPGLISVILMVIAALLTSLTVAREWERGTMEQLISTPVKVPELVIGKLIPYFAIGMLDVLIAVLMSEFVFHVPMRGSLVLLFAVASIFLGGTLSLGMLISITSSNQMLASQVAILTTFLPAFILSGFMFSLVNSPKVVRVLSYLVPARYFVSIIRGIYLKGVGLRELWPDAVFLALFGAVMFVIANLRLRKKLG